ncbi:MAG TPA: hypothetical protein VFX89_06980 [Gammaproteobacteria bacterium]|nr:hypothetical protein [Gammaproteobacteria bacterium]
MKTSLIAGAAALLLAGAASAQLKFDKDGDGALSLDEFRAARDAQIEQRFEQLDANHDGKLTPDELKAGPRRFGAAWRDYRSNIDTNGDGAWSFDELQSVFPSITIERFNKLDKNGDGLITPDEQPARGHGRGGALPHDRV